MGTIALLLSFCVPHPIEVQFYPCFVWIWNFFLSKLHNASFFYLCALFTFFLCFSWSSFCRHWTLFSIYFLLFILAPPAFWRKAMMIRVAAWYFLLYYLYLKGMAVRMAFRQSLQPSRCYFIFWYNIMSQGMPMRMALWESSLPARCFSRYRFSMLADAVLYFCRGVARSEPYMFLSRFLTMCFIKL